MSLPFINNNNSNKRQFQCFVCGILFKSLLEMSSHIKSNHEQGREYIVCPLERCQLAIRDVKSHFKFSHKYDKIPKNCQMRCPFWFDPKDPRKKKKKFSFKEGYFPSAKNRKNLHYRSGWELELYEVLEKMDNVVHYEVEPFAIEYWFNGKQKNYLPDLIVYFRDQHKEIWECKPKNQTSYAINEAKWTACNEYCKKRGWDFKVITEVGLSRLKNDLRLNRDEE